MKNHILFNGKLAFVKLLTMSLLAVLALSRCERQPNFKYIHVDNDSGKLSVTAWEFIQQDDSLSLMTQAIIVCGLQGLYSDSSGFTYMLPTNTAFRDYLKANKYASITDVPIPLLKNVLLYQVVRSEILFSNPTLKNDNPIPYETKNGQVMYLSRNSNYQGLINEGTSKSWTITISNIRPTNGVIDISPAVVYYSAIIPESSVPNTTIKNDTAYTIQDTYVNGGSSSNTNYGSNILLRVKDVDGSGDFDRKAFLMFNLNDIKPKGNLRKAMLDVGVNFTSAKGLSMSLYNVPDTNWSEMTMTWNNAPLSDTNAFSSITTSKVSIFQWDCTKYIASKLKASGKISIKIDGAPGGNETNDLISSRNNKTPHPMLILTFSSGNSNLSMGTNSGLTVSDGGIVVLTNTMLQMDGNDVASDIIYTLVSPPAKGWLVKGNTVLGKGQTFTQADINAGNIVYVHSGTNTSGDSFTLSAGDPDGGSIDPFEVKIKVQ